MRGGIILNRTAPAVMLATAIIFASVLAYPAAGAVSKTWNFSDSNDYASDPAKIGVFLGYAQLLGNQINDITWVKHDSNPVIVNTQGWEGTNVDEATVIYEDGMFKAWYRGANPNAGNARIGFADSSDGITWTKYAGNPIFGSGLNAWTPFVFKNGGIYYMYYTKGTEGGSIDWATSPNGMDWTIQGTALQTSGSETVFGNKYVLIDSGGTWNMLYEWKTTGSDWYTSLATSPDGITWTRYNNGNQVVPGRAGGPEIHKIGDYYYMWATTAVDSGTDIHLYISLDLRTWELLGFQAGLARGATGSWEQNQVADPSVVEVNGRIYMFYVGVKGSVELFGLATFEGTLGDSSPFPSDDPVVSLKSGLAQPFVSLASFSETAAKNGGEIKYQVSNDAGATWHYWDGSAWITTTSGYSNANTATEINDNIPVFSAGSPGQFAFRAYLHSDGSQSVRLDSVSVGYSPTAKAWDFGTPSEYSFDGNAIEVSSGSAGLKSVWWAKPEPNIIIEGTNLWEGNLNSPSAVNGITAIYDGTFKAWYRGGNVGYQTSEVGYATSSDGIAWTKQSTPVFSDAGVENPYVLKRGGTYYMFYVNYFEFSIRLATSSDGINWAPQGIVLESDYLNSGTGYLDEAVFVDSDGSWKMLYDFMDINGLSSIGLAVSADGTSWTDSGIVLALAEEGVGNPEVRKIGNEYYMWALRASEIYMYKSTELHSWTQVGDEPNNFRTKQDEVAGQLFNPSVAEANGATYMFYCVGNSELREYCSVATSPRTLTELIGSGGSFYPDNNPYIVVGVSQPFVSLASFSETAAKNGGEIKYQVSNDAGATWHYWDGSAWITTTSGYSEASTASEINNNIPTFPVGQGQFIFKAYLHSDGSQSVRLDSVSVTYPKPSASSVIAASGSGGITVNYVLIDAGLNTLNILQTAASGIEYSTDGVTWNDATDAGGASEGLTGLSSSAAGVSHVFVWDSAADLSGTYPAVQLRIRPNDGATSADDWAVSSPFAVDNEGSSPPSSGGSTPGFEAGLAALLGASVVAFLMSSKRKA